MEDSCKNEFGQSTLMLAINNNNYFYISKCLRSNNLLQQLEDTDNEKNTLLHYAVVANNFELVRDLLRLGADRMKCNSSGETALDWFRPYTYKFHKEFVEYCPWLPVVIFAGDIGKCKDFADFPMLRRFRFANGNSPLHLAVMANNPVIVYFILKTDDTFLLQELLNKKNCEGFKPLELLATERGTSSKKDLKDIQNLFTQAESKLRLPVKKILGPLPLSARQVEKDIIRLTKVLKRNITEDDLQSLNSYLPLLFHLAEIACHQALELLYGIINSKAPQSKREAAKNLLLKLWGDVSSLQLQRLATKIIRICKEIKNLKEDPTKVVFSFEERNLFGWVKRNPTTEIHLNPTAFPTNIQRLVWTLLHEVGHVANGDVDFAYSDYYDSPRGGFLLDFTKCSLLMKFRMWRRAPETELVDFLLLKTMETLENRNVWFENRIINGYPEYETKFSSPNEDLVFHNVETVGVALFGLAACNSNEATVNHITNMVSISGTFLLNPLLQPNPLLQTFLNGHETSTLAVEEIVQRLQNIEFGG